MIQSIRSHVETSTVVAIYARVSTEDQADRQTIQTQLVHLRQYCSLYSLTVSDEYLDDGVSGTVPLERRPEGSRLLQDAEAGRFGAVVVYRLDRLGRDLRVTMDAHDAMQSHGVALKSSTEQLDTSTPNGRMIFQIMGSFSELEKNTITERTSGGRRRVAGEGRYTGGPIPLGYDVAEDKQFIPSERIVSALGITEAELIRDIFQRIAGGATLNAECKRLTALGIPRHSRYGGTVGKVVEKTGRWGFSSLATILHNPAYRGGSIVQSKYGEIERPMPVLVDPDLWQRAQEAMTRNRTLSRKNVKRDYWLRGLIVCGTCGAAYVGTASSGHRKYRCSAHHPIGAARSEPCRARMLGADWIEAAIWAECRAFIENPGDALEQAKQRLRESMGRAAGFDARRRAVLGELTAKDQERERILTLYRRGVIGDTEAEHQLEAIAKESGHLRESIESMRAQASLLDAQETFLTDSATMLARLRDELARIEATDDWSRRREVIERYVRRIVVDTIETGRRVRDAEIKVYLRLKASPVAFDSATSLAWRQALEASGIALDVWRIHRRIGMSGGLFVSALLREIEHDLGVEETRKIAKLHGDYFAPLASQVRPLNGAIELLAELTRLDVPWAIATSGHMRSAGPSLKMLGVLDGPNPIITRDLVKHAKPDPDLFIAAAGKLGVHVSNCMVVGDSIWDLLAAQRARALGIGLLSGGYGDDELRRAGAYRVYTDPRDLLHHLDEVGVRSPDEAPET